MTVASVVSDTQHLGGRRVFYRFDLDNGKSVHYGVKIIPDEADAQADANTLIPMIDADAVRQEKEDYLQHVASGGMPGDFPLFYSTQNALNVVMFKRALNLMRSPETREDKFHILMKIAPIAVGYTDAQIANAVGWTVAKVTAARVKLVALKQAQDGLDHGEPELDD